MSNGYNKVTLFGYIGRDPELRMTGGGTALLKLSLGTTESYKDRQGEWKERTDWHQIVVWGRQAERLGKILNKGDGVFVEGSLSTRSYDSQGTKRYVTEVVAKQVLFDQRKQEAHARQDPNGPDGVDYDGYGGNVGGDVSSHFDDDDEIPF